jgi:hypothetical protein
MGRLLRRRRSQRVDITRRPYGPPFGGPTGPRVMSTLCWLPPAQEPSGVATLGISATMVAPKGHGDPSPRPSPRGQIFPSINILRGEEPWGVALSDRWDRLLPNAGSRSCGIQRFGLPLWRLFRKRPVHGLGEPRDRRSRGARDARTPVRAARASAARRRSPHSPRPGTPTLRRRMRQPRREPARPNPCRQDERRFPAERLLDRVDRPDMYGLLLQLMNVNHRPPAARRRLDVAVLDRPTAISPPDLPSSRVAISMVTRASSCRKMERGAKLPTLGTLIRFAAALECKVSTLVRVLDKEDLTTLLPK